MKVFDIQCSIFEVYFKYSSIAQSVERMTVNHDVVGSSPTGGVRQGTAEEDRMTCCYKAPWSSG